MLPFHGQRAAVRLHLGNTPQQHHHMSRYAVNIPGSTSLALPSLVACQFCTALPKLEELSWLGCMTVDNQCHGQRGLSRPLRDGG